MACDASPSSAASHGGGRTASSPRATFSRTRRRRVQWGGRAAPRLGGPGGHRRRRYVDEDGGGVFPGDAWRKARSREARRARRPGSSPATAAVTMRMDSGVIDLHNTTSCPVRLMMRPTMRKSHAHVNAAAAAAAASIAALQRAPIATLLWRLVDARGRWRARPVPQGVADAVTTKGPVNSSTPHGCGHAAGGGGRGLRWRRLYVGASGSRGGQLLRATSMLSAADGAAAARTPTACVTRRVG